MATTSWLWRVPSRQRDGATRSRLRVDRHHFRLRFPASLALMSSSRSFTQLYSCSWSSHSGSILLDFRPRSSALTWRPLKGRCNENHKSRGLESRHPFAIVAASRQPLRVKHYQTPRMSSKQSLSVVQRLPHDRSFLTHLKARRKQRKAARSTSTITHCILANLCFQYMITSYLR